MTVDPSEPDTFPEEEDTVLDEEVPEADAAEQHTELRPGEDEPLSDSTHEAADEGDASEQARVVTLDEDDYR
ncbi:hypothetical protein [Streptomyces roseolus]|uniref:hypothetical protein n=1 Tax=Streptomyces roseolus TaxID=67358 RepID=UPI001674F39E|nr:hypothetical protein [Streptomyces roseolus]GGR29154.1 hypothetical protein GCM10010282_22060 [Streptomyces roseolus]